MKNTNLDNPANNTSEEVENIITEEQAAEAESNTYFWAKIVVFVVCLLMVFLEFAVLKFASPEYHKPAIMALCITATATIILATYALIFTVGRAHYEYNKQNRSDKPWWLFVLGGFVAFVVYMLLDWVYFAEPEESQPTQQETIAPSQNSVVDIVPDITETLDAEAWAEIINDVNSHNTP